MWQMKNNFKHMNILTKIVILMALALVKLSHAFADGLPKLSGKVIDPRGEPLSGIMVYVKVEQTGSVTDEQGKFEISLSDYGKIQVNFKGLGFTSKTVIVELSSTSPHQFIDLVLEAKDYSLQEILVMGRKETTYINSYSFMGSKTATKVIDLPQSISSVTKELIEDKQAFLVTDMVGNLAGVNQYSAYDDLTIRGFRNGWESGIRLVNGLRSGYGYGTSFFRVPLTVNLESIEVLKGPGAALFGDVSPGGTVNLTTKKPLEEGRTAINFSAGSFNTLRTTLDVTGPLNEQGNLLYRLNIGYEDSKTFRDVNHRKSLMVAPTVTFMPTDNTTFNAELVYSSFDGYLDRGMGIRGGDLYALPRSFSISQPSDYFNVNDISLNASLNHKFSDRFSFNAGYMKFIYHEDLAEHRTLGTYQDAPSNTIMNIRYIEKKIHETTDNLTAYLSYKNQIGPTQHHWVGGMDYAQFATDKKGHQWEARTQEVNGETQPLTFDLNNPTYELRDPSRYSRLPLAPFFEDYLNTGYRTTGWYLQDQMKVGQKFQMLLGLRHERFSDQKRFDQKDESIMQRVILPRLGLTYKLAENLNFFAGYNQGFRPLPPQYIRNPENYGATSPFRPESSFQYEAGIKAELLQRQVYSTLSLYHIQRNNMLLRTEQVSDSGNPILRQLGGIQSRGIETEWSGNLLPNLSLSFNYAYNLTEVLNSDIESEIGLQAPNAPKHSAGAWIKHTLKTPGLEGFGWGLGLNHVGNRRMENRVQNSQTGEMIWDYWPSFSVVDLSLFYKVDRFKLALNANNIFDSYHFIGGYDYLRAFPGTPRMLMASFGYTF
jgi:iron complex outermembrane recepter protein